MERGLPTRRSGIKIMTTQPLESEAAAAHAVFDLAEAMNWAGAVKAARAIGLLAIRVAPQRDLQPDRRRPRTVISPRWP